MPKTIHDIINCNPHHIYLKVLSKNLINWEKIEISDTFIKNQIPEIIKNLYENDIKVLNDKYFLNNNYKNMDFLNLSLIYHNIICGAFTSLAIKYSGTGNEALKSKIISYINSLEDLAIMENIFEYNFTAKNKIDLYSLYNIYSIISLALGILMAGRCDPNCLQIIKKIIQ